MKEKILEICIGTIHQVRYKTSKGNQLSKGQNIELLSPDNKKTPFVINRIFGDDYLLISEKGKKPKLSMEERLQLVYISLKGKI